MQREWGDESTIELVGLTRKIISKVLPEATFCAETPLFPELSALPQKPATVVRSPDEPEGRTRHPQDFAPKTVFVAQLNSA